MIHCRGGSHNRKATVESQLQPSEVMLECGWVVHISLSFGLKKDIEDTHGVASSNWQVGQTAQVRGDK